MTAGRYIPIDKASTEQWQIEFQGDEHAQSKRQCGDIEASQHDSYRCSDAIQQPWCGTAIHQRLDDGSHSVRLRRYQRIGGLGRSDKAIDVIEHNHYTRNRGGRHKGADKLPSLLLLGSRAEPITYLEVGDKTACHRQGRTDDASHYK